VKGRYDDDDIGGHDDDTGRHDDDDTGGHDDDTGDGEEENEFLAEKNDDSLDIDDAEDGRVCKSEMNSDAFTFNSILLTCLFACLFIFC
jgi:hypothetical protein